MPTSSRIRTTAVLAFAALLAAATAADAQIWRPGDRPRGDYKNFDLEAPNPSLCQDACNADDRCLAWVYVEPGYQGKRARCWLKAEVTPLVYNECCTTSVKAERPPQPCPPLSFATSSPLPPAVVGGHYDLQIAVQGGGPPYEFCAMQIPPDGSPPRCDRSPGQRFSMPAGLSLSPSGRIAGQVQCESPERQGTNCGAGYRSIRIQVRDHCAKRPQTISQEFWIDIKPKP